MYSLPISFSIVFRTFSIKEVLIESTDSMIWGEITCQHPLDIYMHMHICIIY